MSDSPTPSRRIKLALIVLEWSLVVIWLLVAVTKFWSKSYFSWRGKYSIQPEDFFESNQFWFVIMTGIPIIFLWLSAVLSKCVLKEDGMNGQQRFAVIGLLLFGALIAIGFVPDHGLQKPEVAGVFVPLGISGIAVYLWIGWTKNGRRFSDEIPLVVRRIWVSLRKTNAICA